MSGDVQPRKRKDKKRKRDALDRKSEGELLFSRQSSVQDDDESSHGVDITKMAGDDVHLHVHEDHGTGGHWCAKVLFFGLLAVLLGLVALIILENRGSTDLDTPLSESRFSNYFNGWVDEHREDHDHDPVKDSTEEHDEHNDDADEHDDHDEDDDDHDGDDDDHEDDEDHEDDDDHDEDNDATEETTNEDHDRDVDEEAVTEEDDDENATAEREEQTYEEEDEDDNDDNDDENEDDEDNATVEATREETNEEDDQDEDNNDEEDDENATAEDDDNDDNNATAEGDDNDDNNATEEDDDNDDNNATEEDDDNNDDAFIKPTYTRPTQQSSPNSQQSKANSNDDDDPFDEDDDDGTFESVENVVVDNDAEELQLLQEKARQQAAEAEKNADPSDDQDDEEDVAKEAPRSWTALAVKILVGGILPFVARLVLLRKDPNTNNDDEPPPDINMKRRLTIASEEEALPEDETEPLPLLEEDEYSEEEIEIEEEIEYVDEEQEQEYDDEMATVGHYEPETFEQLSAMYRSNDSENVNNEFEKVPIEKSFATPSTSTNYYQGSKKPTAVFNAPHETLGTPTTSTQPSKIEMPKSLYTAGPASAYRGAAAAAAGAALNSPKSTKRDIAHDLDYQPDDEDEEDIDYDDNEIYDDEELGEEEEGSDDDLIDDDVSDVDDAELMSRLEAKYGRLPAAPAKEFESDEDPDDPTWTQIKPKQTAGGGGGPQVNGEDDDDDDYELFEQELRKANEEMMRENYPAALRAFALLSQKYPDKPQMFLGKAKLYDKLAEHQRSNPVLLESLEAYKRYLAFGSLIKNDAEYSAAAERCIERMRFIGYTVQAVSIHEQLIERFSDVPGPRNQLAITYLTLNRLSDARAVLQEILRRWPTDGFAKVHYGYVLKQLKDYVNAVEYLRAGIDSQAEGTQDGRFFFNLGDALQRLGRQEEALVVYERGAALRLFPSVYQRSLYNEPNLRAQPFWTKRETTYDQSLDKLEKNWLAIRDEGLSVLGRSGFFLDETENLRDTGDWKQFELYRRGQRNQKNCLKAPITCNLLADFSAATDCRRGQVKFSVMHAGTHVWPHCGPTNCRLRAHLGLKVPHGTRLRVGKEESTWTEGKFLIFDDSFEHEVWHNGSSLRLVLIVDVWHPDLSSKQRQSLKPI